MTDATIATQEAVDMVAAASSASGLTATPEMTLVSSKNAVGAPDQEQFAIDVYVMVDDPQPPVDIGSVAELWESDFGYQPEDSAMDVRYLVKGERRAEVGDNTPRVEGPGRAWFHVTTEYFDKEAAEAAVASVN